MKLRAVDITLAGMFASLMAIGANITSFIVIGGVPITLTTFFCILAGLLLGSRLGAISMIVYALVGLAGAPVFSHFSGGWSAIVSPTFGFILSYIIVAYVVGKIVERKASKTNFVIAALVGLCINYGFGTNWMYFAYQFLASAEEISYKVAWLWMAAPLPKDLILAVFAGTLAPRLYKSINRNTPVIAKKEAS
ncbi:biotin transporter BioY [Gracilibacillus salinarum]|uniref:Biotin transporter n=1 Tax=Gracilibacillus salinarum TaxID=2932255 RepID=A0ABY4GHJ3_9BACI|nr:biotin transporter BioY [Gracilibacillus salinarum]UOQ83450.1 biotin transporter BioY [Gracilibacillus salinarum]